jgi:hypothetical protein
VVNRGGAKLLLVLLLAFGVVVSCLPDIVTTQTATTCGDGFIDTDAGEQCDPGRPDATVHGCSQCYIECGDDGGPTYVDRTSNHCYFLLSGDSGPSESDSGCSSLGAHVVTLGSKDELIDLAGNLFPTPEAREFWLGLRKDPDADGAVNFKAVVDEPGLARHDVCSGCFGPTLKGGVVLPVNPSGDSGLDPACVTWAFRLDPVWYETNCEAHYHTICEREPVGSRSFACYDEQLCFTVQYDTVYAPGKRYLWSSTAVTAQVASNFCAQFEDAGQNASLVIFESEEEREQVFYELMHLPTPATDFWIGLSLWTPEGGPPQWTWDNGNNNYPSPWGDHEPTRTGPGARAFSRQTGTSYSAPGTTYDTQLAHVPDGGDETETHAVLCQIAP